MNAQEQAQFRWNHVAKPLNSLGKLEQLVVQIAGIQQTADVCINKRCALICCGDHGVVAEGVSQSGSEVTALVAQSIVAGTANINLMASVSGTDVYALDSGCVWGGSLSALRLGTAGKHELIQVKCPQAMAPEA